MGSGNTPRDSAFPDSEIFALNSATASLDALGKLSCTLDTQSDPVGVS